MEGFRQCRAGRRCVVCSLVLSDDALEQVVFHLLVSKDAELVQTITRLEELFYDAADAG